MCQTKLFFLFLFISLCKCYVYIGTAESLRQNLSNLIQGKLKFTDDSVPSYSDELSDITPNNNSEYDFIVIGAGSAGSVLASRLSEIESITVLLIEAGVKEYPIMDIPMMAGPLQFSDQINWKYQTESSSKYCLGFTDSKCKFPRGKVMGGSSVLNFMLATRGTKGDYNEWASLSGDESWSYENMLKYLKKLENFDVKGVEFDSEIHNKGGPIPISSAPYTTFLADAFIEAGKELGYSEIDYNGREEIGFSYFQSTVIHGERWSANRGYLHPAKNRKNLFSTKNSVVNKILIDKKTKSAYGVKFSKFNETIVVKVKKEIILSAGAINSPQILMISGVGPAQHLQDLNIDVIKDAPVGENLMDHPVYPGIVFKTNISIDELNSNILDPKNPSVEDYISQRNGSLALGVGFEALGYINLDNLTATKNPTIELLFATFGGIKDPAIANLMGLSDNYKSEILLNVKNQMFSIFLIITQPKSRGKILLQTNNINDKPKIYINYFNNPDDLSMMIKGIRTVINIGKSNAFKKYGSELDNILSLCLNYVYDSDKYWECALRTFGTTCYHPAGTCRMGREDDDKSVVNSKLQVIGINGLRVADASIMPVITSGHTHIPTVAIAEKLADLIKEEWQYQIV